MCFFSLNVDPKEQFSVSLRVLALTDLSFEKAIVGMGKYVFEMDHNNDFIIFNVSIQVLKSCKYLGPNSSSPVSCDEKYVFKHFFLHGHNMMKI